MPRHYRKKYRKKTKKRKSSNSSWKNNTVQTSTSPLPKTFNFRTRYVEESISLQPTLSIPATHVFSFMSLYDPDVTGGGHQPIGYDQLMLMYDHYTVIGARAKITATNTDPVNTQRMVCHVQDSATLHTNMEEVMENGNVKYVFLGASDSGSATKTSVITFSPKKFFGRSPLDGDKYQGTIASSPSEGAFLHISAGPLTTVSASPVTFMIELEYTAILTEPKVLSQS